MPFKSKAQMRAAFGGYLGPEMKKKAPEWAKETPNMSKLPKKVKKENEDGSIGQLFLVAKPKAGCSQDGMVQAIDPLVGLSGSEIVPDQVHGVYPDQDLANSIAETLCAECMQYETMLEEKKSTVTDKIKKAIDKLEKQRKEHIKMATEDPKNASQHKHHVAQFATKIDDLMTKLEKIEKSKKPVEKEKEDKKKELNESKSVETSLKGTKEGEMVELVLDDNSKKIMQRAGSNKKGEPTFKHVNKDGKATGSASAVSVSHIKSVKKHKHNIKEGNQKDVHTIGDKTTPTGKVYFIYNNETGTQSGTYKSKEEAQKALDKKHKK